MNHRISSSITAATLLAGFATSPVYSQEASTEPAVETIPVKEPPAAPVEEVEPQSRDATQLDTIEVTANKRIKSQRDVPGSVSAIRGEALEKINAQGLSDYLKLVPGVTMPEGDPDGKVPVIRGIATSTNPTGSYQSLNIGIYADDMPFTDPSKPLVIPDLNPFDLERVEILKGPQGTLYGSGALSGLIQYVLQKPKLAVWEGKLLASVTSTKFSESLGTVTGAALNVPLFGDKFAVRAVGLYRDQPGVYDEIDQSGLGDRADFNSTDFDSLEQSSGRLLAAWQVTDRLKLSGLYFYQQTEQADVGSADNRESFTRDPEPFPIPRYTAFSGASLTADYEFDWGQLKSATSRVTKDFQVYGNLVPAGTRIPEDPNDPQDPRGNDDTDDFGLEDQELYSLPLEIFQEVEGYSQEIRLTSPEGGAGDWDWLVGGFYESYDQFYYQDQNTAPRGTYPSAADFLFPIGTPLGRLNGSRNLTLIYYSIDFNSYDYALFGEATRRLGEHWEVTTGLRAFKQGLIADTVVYGALGNGISGNTESVERHEYSERGLTPRISLRYKHDRNIQVFALASRGYQFGGVQLNPLTIGLQQDATEAGGGTIEKYKSSDLWNYELGLRTEWLDRRLRFDVTLFYLDWKDLQLDDPTRINQTGVQDDQIQFTVATVGNVGGAHSEGLELALEVAPFAGATFTSAAAWVSALTDTEYEASDGTLYPGGTRLPASARFQWVNLFAYGSRLPYFESIEGSFGLSHTYTGTYFNDLEKTVEGGGYGLLDANLGLRKSDAVVWLPELNFNATNLTDVRGVSSGSEDLRRKVYYFIRPRTYLLTLAWRF